MNSSLKKKKLLAFINYMIEEMEDVINANLAKGLDDKFSKGKLEGYKDVLKNIESKFYDDSE